MLGKHVLLKRVINNERDMVKYLLNNKVSVLPGVTYGTQDALFQMIGYLKHVRGFWSPVLSKLVLDHYTSG
ncbi:hypothetical protein [Anaplasma phagocytophilum]|uniref:hypothetical protein n=1 Tax=Anaplasma phagocytophilum TaxID=948 RepID=UPI00201AD386